MATKAQMKEDLEDLQIDFRQAKDLIEDLKQANEDLKEEVSRLRNLEVEHETLKAVLVDQAEDIEEEGEIEVEWVNVDFHQAAGNRFSFISGTLQGSTIGKIRGGLHDFRLMLIPKEFSAEPQE